MKQYYSQQQNMLVEIENESNIVNYYHMSEDEIIKLINDYSIDRHTITSSLDHEEVPRYEVENGMINMIWKIPALLKMEETPANSVLSLGIFVRGKNLIIITDDKIDLLNKRFHIKIETIFDLILNIQFETMISYIEHLKIIKEISREIQKKIITAMENTYLLKMFDLSEVLVYYCDAISGNKSVLDKMKSHIISSHEQFDELFCQDLFNETDQAKNQAEIYSQVLSGLMDARGTIVNNNMNILIKNLTIINIIFLPLNLIASIGGMSEYSLLTKKFSWVLSYGLLVVFMIILSIILLVILNRSGKKLNNQK